MGEANSSYGHQRSVPSMWIKAAQKNGHIRHGKQKHPCKACERQFGATATENLMAEVQRSRIAHLWRERIALRGLCRAVGVSLTWLLHCMVACFAACPDALHVPVPSCPTDVRLRLLEAEADDRWSFVKKKANKHWIWLAMEAITRQSLAFPVGERRRDSAKELWAKLPWVDREQATFHTDQYDAYTGVMPAERPKASTKKARQTKHIERFNTTLR
jgi:insertion element IS1 protein InsB